MNVLLHTVVFKDEVFRRQPIDDLACRLFDQRGHQHNAGIDTNCWRNLLVR